MYRKIHSTILGESSDMPKTPSFETYVRGEDSNVDLKFLGLS